MDYAKMLLIIDDDPNAREVLQQVLAGQDYTMAFASSGPEGLAKALDLIPDLILLDVMMPGMDGLEVCRRLRADQRLAEVPIILITALDDYAARIQGLDAGADDFISKHFDFAELRARVRTITRLNRYRRLLVERAKFARVVELAPNGVLLVDTGGTIHLTNPASQALLGADQQDQVLGQPLSTFITPAHHDRWATWLQEVLNNTAHTVRAETLCVRLDGTTFPAEVDIGSFVWDAQPLAQLIVRDVTERRRAEVALRQSEQRFRDLFERSPDAIFVTTLEGIVVDVNPAACRLQGHPRADLLGQHLLDLVPQGQQAASALLFQRLVLGEIDRGEGFIAQASGRAVPIEVRTSQIDYAGAPALLLHVRDISERKQLEAQLLQAQKMESIGRLASGLAHDFNNLLTAISGYANLALERLAADDPLYGDLREIDAAADRASSLTRQLLAFARKQIIEPRTINLNELIVNLDKLLRRLIGEDIELITQAAPDLLPIKADPSQIEQLLVNLAVNARDAMPQGGKLLIETRNIGLDDTYVRQHVDLSAGCFVALAITDTGVGMDATVQQHLFEPFFTTKAPGKGTGLGLATCYGIVKQHGGHIAVYSEVGHGTTIQIYLPSSVDTAEPQLLRDDEGLPRGNETLLLVEDDQAVRKLAARVLRDRGYTVLEAADGAAALRVVETYERNIALVLTDVIMPQMGGKALAEQLAVLRPEIKVLFMSGYTDNAMIQHRRLDEGAAFLQKPFSPAALAWKVREMLG